MIEAVVPKQRGANGAARGRDPGDRDAPTFGVDQDHRASDGGDRRTGVEEINLPSESVRERDVIGVRDSDVLAASLAPGAVQRRRDPFIGLVRQDPDAAVGRSEPLEDRARGVL